MALTYLRSAPKSLGESREPFTKCSLVPLKATPGMAARGTVDVLWIFDVCCLINR